MKSAKQVVDLRLLPLFLDRFNSREKYIDNIVKALEQQPLPSDGVDTLRLLRFLWTNASLGINQKMGK